MRNRTAFTLLEIMLVLVLLLVAASLTLPMIGSMYQSAKVRAAADAVRAALLQARAHAMNEGRDYRFSVLPGGIAFRVAPDDDAFWTGSGEESGQAQSQSPSGVTLPPAFIYAENLPAGIRFDTGNGAPAVPAAPTGPETPEDPPASKIEAGRFVTQVVFSPEGVADTDFQMVLQLPGAQPLVLTLRGMTGVSTVKPQTLNPGASNP
jgi:prepilin-type N-terminal cleavage/methylation domain-containing protein